MKHAHICSFCNATESDAIELFPVATVELGANIPTLVTFFPEHSTDKVCSSCVHLAKTYAGAASRYLQFMIGMRNGLKAADHSVYCHIKPVTVSPFHFQVHATATDRFIRGFDDFDIAQAFVNRVNDAVAEYVKEFTHTHGIPPSSISLDHILDILHVMYVAP